MAPECEGDADAVVHVVDLSLAAQTRPATYTREQRADMQQVRAASRNISRVSRRFDIPRGGDLAVCNQRGSWECRAVGAPGMGSATTVVEIGAVQRPSRNALGLTHQSIETSNEGHEGDEASSRHLKATRHLSTSVCSSLGDLFEIYLDSAFSGGREEDRGDEAVEFEDKCLCKPRALQMTTTIRERIIRWVDGVPTVRAYSACAVRVQCVLEPHNVQWPSH